MTDSDDVGGLPPLPEHLDHRLGTWPQPGQARPGYGIRRTDLVELLAPLSPAAVERVVWGEGTLPLEVAAYPTPMEVPGDLVGSVRCLVRVDTRIVVCQTPHGPHVLPGGRRQPGETYEATACREVYEETGWLVRPADLGLMGFLHYRHLQPAPAGHPHLHPDFLQLIYAAPARARDDSRGPGWVDVEGWEQGYELRTAPELAQVPLAECERVFVDLLDAR